MGQNGKDGVDKMDGTRRGGTGRDATGRDGTRRDGCVTEWGKDGCDRTRRDGMSRKWDTEGSGGMNKVDGTGWDGTGCLEWL